LMRSIFTVNFQRRFQTRQNTECGNSPNRVRTEIITLRIDARLRSSPAQR
jgi:hypothetical protein